MSAKEHFFGRRRTASKPRQGIAVAAPDWLRAVAPADWHDRYDRRVEDMRLPDTSPKREVYAAQVGTNGFVLLDALVDRIPAENSAGKARKPHELDTASSATGWRPWVEAGVARGAEARPPRPPGPSAARPPPAGKSDQGDLGGDG